MKELSIFVDESGDFGEYNPHSPFYIISMVMHDQAVDITEDLAKLEKNGSVYACGKYVDGEGSKIWDFKLYEDTLRTPEEFMDDGLHEPVELVCSDKFQTMENKSDQLLKTFWRDMGMNNKSFDSHRIAEGYAKRPWLHKGVIDRFRKDCGLPDDFIFSNGLDVGCGAGLSTKALKLICRHVTGTDIAESMVEVCNELYGSDEAYSFYTAGAEDTLIPDEKYDVVSAAGMVNWVDEKKFMENLIKVTKDECFIIIYDFWITDKMKNVPEYTSWYQDEYLKRFPKPPRKENIWTDADLISGLKMYKQINYELIHSFSLDDFIDFMMIQSNVNAKIESGEMAESQVRSWMKDTLSPIFKDKEQELVFDGYTWYIKR